MSEQKENKTKFNWHITILTHKQKQKKLRFFIEFLFWKKLSRHSAQKRKNSLKSKKKIETKFVYSYV